MFARLRRKSLIRRRKGERETLAEDAVRFQDIVVSKTQARGVAVPTKLLRELQRGSEQRDGGKRLYKLDLRRAHLTDSHVEALTEALQELPVVRKLDLRGNDAMTAQALHALNLLLKSQVELFRMVQADASLADSSLSFLYSVKLDAVVLSLDRAAAGELEAHTAALEVADSVLDVRHAFFEADIREAGTLTEHELSDAMRSVLGVTPKPGETSRVLRFFGERGPAGQGMKESGRYPTVISLGGFEAAMAGRLRDSHTLPMLPKGHDDLLFGSAEDAGDQDDSERFSPWSTRSFSTTTGSHRGSKGSGGGGGGWSGGTKRSPLSASQDLRSAAEMKRHVLPSWCGGEAGCELGATMNESERSGISRVAGELDDIFDGDNGASTEEESRRDRYAAASSRGGSDRGRLGVENGVEIDGSELDRQRSSTTRGAGKHKGVEGGSDRSTAREKANKHGGCAAPLYGELESSSKNGSRPKAQSLKDDALGNSVLSDCSSDDDLSCSSPSVQRRASGLMTPDRSRLRNELATSEGPQIVAAGGSSEPPAQGFSGGIRPSYGPKPAVKGVERMGSIASSESGGKKVLFLEGSMSGGWQSSAAPRPPPPRDNSITAELEPGASTHQTLRRRHSLLEGDWRDNIAVERGPGGDQIFPLTSSVPALRQQEHGTGLEMPPLPRRSDSNVHQTTTATTEPPPTDGKDRILGSEEPPTEAGASNVARSGAEPAEGEAAKLVRQAFTSPSVSTRGTEATASQSPRTSMGEDVPVAGGSSPGMKFESGIGAGWLGVPNEEGTAPGGVQKHNDMIAGGEANTVTVVGSPGIVAGGISSVVASVSEASTATTKCEVRQVEAGVATKIVQREAEAGSTFSARQERQPMADGDHVHPSLTSSSPEQRPDGSLSERRCGEEARQNNDTAGGTDSVPPLVAGCLSGVGGLVKASGKTAKDINVANPSCVAPQPMAATQLRAVSATNAQVLTTNKDGGDIDKTRSVTISKYGVLVRSPLAAIAEAPGRESSGINSACGTASGDEPAVPGSNAAYPLDLDFNSGSIRKPYCLSPTNVIRQARGSGATATAGSSCRERERLAARIQHLAGIDVAAAAAAATSGTNPARQCFAPGLLPLSSSATGSGFDGGGFGTDSAGIGGGGRGGSRSESGSPIPSTDADPSARLLPAGRSSVSPSVSRGRLSPARVAGSSGWGVVGGPPVGDGHVSSSSPSSRFYLPSSETKTAPLCGTGGSTSLFDSSAMTSNRSVTGGRGEEGVRYFSRDGTEGSFPWGTGKSSEAFAGGEVKESGWPRADDEQLALQLHEGILIIRRSGLDKMGALLELEAVYDGGLKSLIGLQTLTLSYNRLQVLEMSVLTTMPALRHLDVSHNLLCRMEPMDGRDLPPRLETLNMSHNRILRIGGIGQCFLLRVVNLRHNRIKRVQGLEHLSLLEQLDLGHNLLSKAASARALSFNRSLKLLWLEGNPLARHPRYRPTLTCLLPHVRAIDSRGMPPCSDSEQRRWGTGGGSVGEEDECDRFCGSGAAGAAKQIVGATGGNSGISREWQAGQDERRSKEWHQMMERRKAQARREEDAHGLASGMRHDSRQAVSAAQQRRQTEELARPRTRACPSEEAISKAKAMACHRPAVAFGASYRSDSEWELYPRSTAHAAAEITTLANELPPTTKNSQDGLFGDSADGFKLGGGLDDGAANREDNAFAHASGFCELGMPRREPRDGSMLLQHAREVGVDGSLPFPQVQLAPTSGWPSSKPMEKGMGGDDDRTLPLPPSDQVSVTTTKNVEDTGLMGSSSGGDNAEVARVVKAREDRGVDSSESSDIGHTRNEGVESWLLDVKLETQTAGTALRVLLRMCKERGRHDDEKKRLSSFRTALEGMGLFSPQHGPMPTNFGEDESGLLEAKVIAAARQVAMTKAAVKNMLRLMESAEPDENGSAELNQYADFIRQQGEITIGRGDYHNAGGRSHTTQGDAASAFAAQAEQREKHSISPMSSDEVRHTEATTETNEAAVTLLSSSSLYTTLDTFETAVDSRTTQSTTRATNFVRSGVGRQDTVVTGQDEAPEGKQQGGLTVLNGARSLQPVLQPVLDVKTSAHRTTAVDAAASSGATPPPIAALAAASNATMTPVEGVTQAAAMIDPDTQKTKHVSLADPEGNTSGYIPDKSARLFDGPESLSEERGEVNGRNVTKSPEAGNAESLMPAPPCLVSCSNVVATAASTSPPSYVNSEGVQPHGTCLQPEGDSVPSGSGVNNSGGVGVNPVVLAAGAEVERHEAGRTNRVPYSASAASSVVAASSAASLSARERLLRHVRSTTSPRSDVSSSSSDRDDDDIGDTRPIATPVVHLEDGAITAEDGDDRKELNGGNDIERGGEDDPVVADGGVEAEQDEATGKARLRKESNPNDGRPLTTRPEVRRLGGREKGGEGEGGGGSKATGPVDSKDTGVERGMPSVPSTAISAKSSAITDVPGSLAVLVGDNAVASSPASATETADAGSNQTTTKDIGRVISSDVSFGRISDAVTAQELGSNIPEEVATEGACDFSIGHSSEGEVIGDGPVESTLDEITMVAIDDSLDTQDPLVRPETIANEGGVEGRGLLEAADKPVEEEANISPEETITTFDEKDPATGDGEASDCAYSKTAAKATKATGEEGHATTTPPSGGDGDAKTDGPGDEIASTDAASTEPAWIEGYDPGHDCYYYHHVPTGESRWYKPDEPYEPYVHSDDHQEQDDGVLSSFGDGVQPTETTPDDNEGRRREKMRRSAKDSDGASKHHGRKQSGWDDEEATSRRTSSSHKREESSTDRRRTSSTSKVSKGSGRRSRSSRDNGKHVSRSSLSLSPSSGSGALVEQRRSRDGPRGNGRQRSNGKPSHRRRRTALERLEDLTDEASCGSEYLPSDKGDGGGGRHRKKDRRGPSPDYNDDSAHRSSRRRSNARDDGEREYPSTRTKGENDQVDGSSSHPRRRSTKSSNGRYDESAMSSDGGSRGRNDEDLERQISSVKRSGSGRGGSGSRREGS